MTKKAPGLDVVAVVDASLAIADVDGLEGLTMRRLAARLGVTPMAIYHHVANKDQLLDLMADESLRALPPLDPDGAWDAELERLFLGFHRLYVTHPALAWVMTERPLEGPIAIGIGEQVLLLLTGAGLDDEAAVAAFIAIMNYTVGASLYRISRARARPAGADGGRSRLELNSRAAAPISHRLRHQIAAAADDEAQFTDGVRRLIRSYR